MPRLPLVRRPVVLGLALLCLSGAGSAWADDTVLRLAETATVMVTPDELAASLRAEAAAPTSQDAQRRVNDMMRDAVAAAKAVPGVIVSTGGYNVWRVAPSITDRNERWQAGQTLSLSGKDGEALLRLVGDLQQKGLAEGSLGWRLSRDAERTARKQATKDALAGLRGRADEAADVLGLKFGSFKEVRLDSVSPPLIPRQQTGVMRASMAGAAPPPTAERDDLPVSASAEADILLKPR
jgi:predicted secreted protein